MGGSPSCPVYREVVSSGRPMLTVRSEIGPYRHPITAQSRFAKNQNEFQALHAQAPDEVLIRDTFPLPAGGPDDLPDLSPDRLVLDVCRVNGNSKYRRIGLRDRQASIPTKTRRDTPRRAGAPDQRTGFDL